MYGKFFASAFSGSMLGAGPDVFAVWGYVIAHTVKGTLELNPKLLAVVIGMPEERVDVAIKVLCAPDPNSRSQEESGRRLVHEDAFQYRVVNHGKYRGIRNEDDRREYNKLAKRRQRERDNAA